MPLFSFIVLTIIIYLILFKKVKETFIGLLCLASILNIHIGIGYFIQIGNFDFGYYNFVLLFLFLYSGILLYKQKLNKKKSLIGILYILSVIISLFGLLLNPVSESVTTGNSGSYTAYLLGLQNMIPAAFVSGAWKTLIWIIVYVIIAITIYSILTLEDWKKIIRIVVKFTKIIIFFVLLEMVIKYLLPNFSNIYFAFLKNVFGESQNTLYTLLYRYNGIALQGFTREPAQFIYSAFISLLLFSADGIINRRNNILWLLLLIILMIFSTSFSMIMSFALIGLYILLSRASNNTNSLQNFFKNSIFIVFLLIILSVLVYQIKDLSFIYNSTIYIRLLSSINISKDIINGVSNLSLITNDSSGLIRLYSAIDTIKLIEYRPLFGIGLSTTTSLGSLALIIAELGIIGTLVCIYFQFFTLKIDKLKYSVFYFFAILAWALSQLFVSHGDMIFYGIENILISLSLLIIFNKTNLEKR